MKDIFPNIFSQNTEAKSSFTDKLIGTAIDMGMHLLINGAETHRVEDTITRICTAYGASRVEVFAIPSLISASVRMPEGAYSAQIRRIYSVSNNMARLEALNYISRKICAETPDLEEADKLILSAISCKKYPLGLRFFANAIAAGGFAVFFGGTLLDGAAAALIGILMMLYDLFRPKGINPMSHTIIKSFFSGLAAFGLTFLLRFLGFSPNIDKIMIGSIMLMIPGLSLGNSLRDLLCGDIIAGTLQLIQSLLLAIVIAFGFAVSIVLFRGVVL